MIDVRIQSAAFDAGRQLARLGDLKKAAVASFVGRLEAADDVTAIQIDHHPALARAELSRIAAEAEARWPLGGLVLIHRHGRLEPCDAVIFAGVAASDIADAEAACVFLVDEVRRGAPFWRKDLRADGSGDWR